MSWSSIQLFFKNSQILSETVEGTSVLDLAIQKGCINMVRKIFDKTKVCRPKSACLHIAVRNENVDILRFLLAHGEGLEFIAPHDIPERQRGDFEQIAFKFLYPRLQLSRLGETSQFSAAGRDCTGWPTTTLHRKGTTVLHVLLDNVVVAWQREISRKVASMTIREEETSPLTRECAAQVPLEETIALTPAQMEMVGDNRSHMVVDLSLMGVGTSCALIVIAIGATP